MISDSGRLVQEAADFVFRLLKERLPAGMHFHDFAHTMETTMAARQIAQGMACPSEEIEWITLAGLFHDTGYIETYAGHEAAGAKIAESFLRERGYSEAGIRTVCRCILATQTPPSPSDKLEAIICDADMHNVASDSHLEKTRILRREWEALNIKSYGDPEWWTMERDFLASHRFHTPWAEANWNHQKLLNLEAVEKQLSKVLEKKNRRAEEEEKEKRKDEKALSKLTRPERGIETMFRTAARNHINLSSIADNKANIMLSINALIISVVISGLAPKLDSNPVLILPTIMLLVVCIVTIVFATLSTRPKITHGKFTREDIANKRSNLLFFGNFFNMPQEEYLWGMDEMMKDRDFLYGSLTRDLHSLGVVLAQKYRYLRLTYTFFMWGLILVVLSFGISFYLEIA